jgi:microcin C transport system permease protein
MLVYLIKRLLAIIPTLFGITIIVFLIINLAPGSPIEQKIQAIRFGGQHGEGGGAAIGGGSHRTTAVTNEVIEALKKQYGFDKPIHIRYWIWLKNLSRFDFGKSFKYEEPVTDVLLRKMPVSIMFGVTSFILSYLVCIPLGVLKAVKNGSRFDVVTSGILFLGYSTPSFMLAVLLIVFFCGGSFLNIFPIAGLVSDNYADLSFFGKVWDRIHHAILPLTCYMVGQFTTLTVLMKNSVLEEIRRDYVRTARAKGLTERVTIYKHVLRNALVPIATGFGHILSIFFAGSLLLEQIFGLDGLGLLGYESVLARDYNVIMGLLVIESLLFLLGNILSDFCYVLIDPRIDFSATG